MHPNTFLSSSSSSSSNNTSNNTSNNNSPILVTVRPSQSAFFAGESFSCTLEFSNLQTPLASSRPSSPAFLPRHARSSSSIFLPSLPTPFSPPTPSGFSSTSSFASEPRPSVSLAGPLPPRRPFSSSLAPPGPLLPTRKGLIGAPESPELPPPRHARSRSIPVLGLAQLPTRSVDCPPSLSRTGTPLSPAIQEEDQQFPEHRPSSYVLAPLDSRRPTATSTARSPLASQWASFSPARRVSLQGYSAPPGRQSFSTEVVLGWAYCQLEGIFEVDGRLIRSDAFDALRVRSHHGGGQLSQQAAANDRSGWIGWLFSATGSGYAPGSSAEDKKRRRLPVFENAVSLLDVDMRLQPGDTRKYSFSMDLPQNLPPSFRGRSIKFVYNLIVGTNYDAGSRSRTPGAGNRVMRVPIRVYNHVFLSGARPFYDLHSPIINVRDMAHTRRLDHHDKADAPVKTQVETGEGDLEAYALKLLRRATDVVVEEPEDELPGGCMTAVEIVTRSSGKVSFDINQAGKPVAQLTLVKSAYRLGEIVEGTLEFNLSPSSGRVIKASVTLESAESIETSHLSDPARSGESVRAATSKVHSDFEEFLLFHNRTKFSLVIPTDGTPEFATSGVRLQWSLRLRIIFLPSTPQRPLASSLHHRIGSTVNPAGIDELLRHHQHQHNRSKSFAYGPSQPIFPSLNHPTHLLPVNAEEQGVFKPVPDLGFVPVRYPSSEVVLVPAKLEKVECSIPVKVFPSNTAFKPFVTQFFA